MSVRYATPEEVAIWNDHVTANPDGGNILQGKEFIDQKVATGWVARYIFVDRIAVAVVEKRVPILGKIWYCPKGPSAASAKALRRIIDALKPFAKAHGVFTIKIEPELDYQTDMSDLDLIVTQPIQYNYSTVYVDLSPSEHDILKNLNQKGRHAIRRAERDGVTVKQVEPNDENCRVMYELFQQTGAGAGFAIRPAEYYQRFYTAYGENGGLFFAYYEGQVVAGAFAMVQGTNSMYKDGASVRDRQVYGASHLLQWHVMVWAKQRGSLKHDLAGVPPIKDIKDPLHPFSGLARFKTSFNKEVTQYVGAFEVPVIRWKTVLWNRLIEKIVRRWHFKTKHESYY